MNNIILYQGVKDVDGMKLGMNIVKSKLENIGISFSFFFKPTFKTFSGVQYPTNDVVANPISVNPTEILKEVDGKYRTACLIYDWDKVFPKPTNPAHHGYMLNGCTPMQIPVQWYSDLAAGKTYPEVLAQFYLHELSHAYSFLSGQPDKTHLQHTFPEWSNKQPIDYYLHLLQELKPYWKIIEGETGPIPPAMKTVTLTRRWDNGTQTLGELSVGDFNCKTLELPWRDNKSNISCIPKGEYICKWVFNTKFGWCYQVMNVPGRFGILLHPGNFFFNVQGCILFGTHYTDLNGDPYADIANSKVTLSKFNSLMNKKDFKLIIK